jgi:RimJ/RimL family protein N-acetyltransferase
MDIFKQEIILEDERVLIRPLQEKDKEHMIEWMSDPSLSIYSMMQIKSARDVLPYVDQCLEDRRIRKRYPFVFFDKHANAFAGTSCFGNIAPAHQRLEIGWTKIATEFQGTGLNIHCKFLMLQYIFEELVYNRVEFKSHEDNIRSRRAMEKIGAKYEGLLRYHMIMPDGSHRNTVYYSILRDEWREVQAMLKSLMLEELR